MTTWAPEIPGTIRSAAAVAKLTGMNEEQQAQMERLLSRFPMAVTPYYLSLIDWNDPNDPIRRMCIPSLHEHDLSGAFDTSGEADNTVDTGLQHKYRQTALVLTTNRCAMYCRHCFRKRLVGLSDEEIAAHFGDVVSYIRDHTEINNVLLSGGDALMLPNDLLRQYLSALTPIRHLDLIRIGTRIPVVYPARISEDKDLLAMLEAFDRRKQLYIITQFNHPNEITPEAAVAIKKLYHRGIVVKNQTVLLKGVNDSPDTLALLLHRLTACGIVPYYVFQCRPVSGVMNGFQVPLMRGYDVVERAKAMQNGQGKCFKYCLSHPTGKIEIAGKLDSGEMVFKYHQTKEEQDEGRIFIQRVREDQGWLDQIP